jgi:hypothetical protein
VARRTDLQARFADLTRQVTLCIAAYPPSGSSTDRRLPWAVDLPQAGYVLASQYPDQDNNLYGRAPYDVDRSNHTTGFSNDTLLESVVGGGQCSTWTARDDAWWKHWKDHLFYAVSDRFAPNNSPPNTCSSSCLEVNAAGGYPAVVLFAGRANAGQVRSPLVADDSAKGVIANYLEGENATMGDAEFQSVGSAPFNDVAYCVNPSTSSSPPVTGAIPLPNASNAKFWVHPC